MSSPIPFFSLIEQWQQLKPRIMPKLEALLDKQQCIGGPAIASFEKAFATFTGADHALSCSSGSTALWLALLALDIKPGDIVLTTPFSFIASSSEIYAHGAHPVYIDIEPITMNMDPELLRVWLKENTHQEGNRTIHTLTNKPVTGILAVNIFGQCANYTALRQLATEHHLWIIEDAAQSVGALHTGKASGTLADISCFSFYPTKNLGAAGDAGMLTTNNPALATSLAKLKNHGRLTQYNYEGFGINGRMDALQAVILEEKLLELPRLLERRRAIARRYTQALQAFPGVFPPVETDFHTYHQYTIRIEPSLAGLSRDELIAQLTAAGIGTCIFYPKPLSTIAYLQTDPQLFSDTPVTHRVCQTMLSLPIWPELSDVQVTHIIHTATDLLTRTVAPIVAQTEPTL